MIIDCHGHYTTEPQKLHDFRKGQIAAIKDPAQQALRLRAQDQRRRVARKRRRRPAQVPARARHQPHHLLAARLGHVAPHRRRGREPRMVAGVERADLPAHHALPEQLHRRLPAAAIARRQPQELHRRVGALRQRIRLRRLQPQSRSVRRPLGCPAGVGPLLVSALREDGRARRARHDPCQRVLQSRLPHHRRALHQRRHHRLHAAHHVGPVQGFPDAEIHHSRTAAARCPITGAAIAGSPRT